MESELLKHSTKNADCFYSKEMKDGLEYNDLDMFLVDMIIDSFLGWNRDYTELISLHSKKQGLERLAILAAHGDYQNNSWVYTDGKNDFPVQGWIDQMDGKYSLLILYCCNPNSGEISSKRSAVLAPNYIYSGFRMMNCDGQVELYLPKIGYVNPYIAGFLKEQMEKGEEVAGPSC